MSLERKSFTPGTRVRKIFGANVGRTGVVLFEGPRLRVHVRWDDTSLSAYVHARYIEEIEPTSGRRLKVTPGTPVKFDPDGAATFEGDFEYTVEDLEDVVQVRVSGTAGKWTYRDPSGKLDIGERVIVPFGSSNGERLATVVEHGRDTYSGPLKSVYARVLTEELQ